MLKKMNLLMAVILVSFNIGSASAAVGVCQAYTQCLNPYTGPYVISCAVWGDAMTGVACNFNVVAGRSVHCNGFNGSGMWETFNFYCQ
jgi:hypothetical protein